LKKSCGVGVVWPHHTHTTTFFKKCGVGVVWVWFERRLSVVCHRMVEFVGHG